jgi:heat shock protein HtpX
MQSRRRTDEARLPKVTGAGPVHNGRCPICGGRLATVGAEPRWCPACEWNLAAATPTDHTVRQSRSRRRESVRSFASDERLFAECAARVPSGPGWSPGLLAVTVISILLGAATLALLVVGVVLLVNGSLIWKIVGILLAGAAFELRPRLPAVQVTSGYKTRADLPVLFELIDAVGGEFAAPRMHAVVVNESFDASCNRVGLRRRPVLVLGLPLWASLSPAGRIGLLGHQLAHLVDHDPEQNLLTQPALSTVGTLANAFARRGPDMADIAAQGEKQGEGIDGWYAEMIGGESQRGLESFGSACAAVIFMPLHWVCARLDRRLRAVTAHSRQRAEYYADALAADIAGSAAMIEYFQAILLHEQVFSTARRSLRVGADVETIRIEAAGRIASYAAEIGLREQLSMRTESSLLAGHPPIGRRLRMLRAWPTSVGTLSPGVLDFTTADAQLQPDFRRVTRALAHLP